MSMLACDECGDLIDTDIDPESHDEKTDKWICEGCRDDAEKNREAGREHAEQENGALAGMAEMPEVPANLEGDSDFEAGYERFHADNEIDPDMGSH